MVYLYLFFVAKKWLRIQTKSPLDWSNHHQSTLVIIKPRGVARGKIGDIISRFEDKGMELSAIKRTHCSLAQAEEHYMIHEDNVDKFKGITNYLSSGPIVVCVFSGINAIVNGRIIVDGGQKVPEVGSIRGKLDIYGSNENSIHASDSEQEALREIQLWFPV